MAGEQAQRKVNRAQDTLAINVIETVHCVLVAKAPTRHTWPSAATENHRANNDASIRLAKRIVTITDPNGGTVSRRAAVMRGELEPTDGGSVKVMMV